MCSSALSQARFILACPSSVPRASGILRVTPKASVAPGQTREGIAAVVSALQEAVADAPDAATASEFAATVFAREGLLTNLGSLSFPGQFGALKLKAIWGPAVLDGSEDEQTIGAATVGGTLSLLHTSHTPHAGLLEAMQSVLAEACA